MRTRQIRQTLAITALAAMASVAAAPAGLAGSSTAAGDPQVVPNRGPLAFTPPLVASSATMHR